MCIDVFLVSNCDRVHMQWCTHLCSLWRPAVWYHACAVMCTVCPQRMRRLRPLRCYDMPGGLGPLLCCSLQRADLHAVCWRHWPTSFRPSPRSFPSAAAHCLSALHRDLFPQQMVTLAWVGLGCATTWWRHASHDRAVFCLVTFSAPFGCQSLYIGCWALRGCSHT